MAAHALPDVAVLLFFVVGVGAVFDGSKRYGAFAAFVFGAVRVGAACVAGGAEVDAALGVEGAGFDEGVAAAVGGDVAQAGEADDLVGAGLVFCFEVFAAVAVAVDGAVGLDEVAVGGEFFCMGVAVLVGGSQEFDVASGVDVDAAFACFDAGRLQEGVAAAVDFDGLAAEGAGLVVEAGVGVGGGAALFGEEVGVGDDYGAAALVEGVLACEQGDSAACVEGEVAFVGGQVGAAGDEVAAREDAEVALFAGEAAALVALVGAVGAGFAGDTLIFIRQPCQ